MTADEVIRIAAEEIGYLEKSRSAYLRNPEIVYQRTAGAGYDNYTKYWVDLCPTFQGQPWCDAFVSWIFDRAGGRDLLCGGFSSYYCPNSATAFAREGKLTIEPRVGDQIFFTKNGKTGTAYHTGIVVGVDSLTITTIEGNTSAVQGAVVPNGGGVTKKIYSRNSKAIKNALFGHPEYEPTEGEAPPPEDPPATKPESLFEEGHRTGTRLTVTASILNLRDRPGVGSGRIIGQIQRGKTVIWYGYYAMIGDQRWLYVQYGGKSGYILSDYTKHPI